MTGPELPHISWAEHRAQHTQRPVHTDVKKEEHPHPWLTFLSNAAVKLKNRLVDNNPCVPKSPYTGFPVNTCPAHGSPWNAFCMPEAL